MDEMIRYIFGSLRCFETAMRVFAKTLRKQRSFNRSTIMGRHGYDCAHAYPGLGDSQYALTRSGT